MLLLQNEITFRVGNKLLASYMIGRGVFGNLSNGKQP